MSKHARTSILNRLNMAVKTDPVSLTNVRELTPRRFNQTEKIETLKSLMEAIRTEVHVIDFENWTDSLMNMIKGKRLKHLLYAPDTDMGKTIEEEWDNNRGDLPELIPYKEKIGQFKPWLFEVDASITTAKGAIIDVGAIILCPDEKEPRSMSLVPSVHIAVLKKEKIYNNLSEIIRREGWSESMPTNALLISGPSKTADIELTLAYGVHGPKELILFIV